MEELEAKRLAKFCEIAAHLTEQLGSDVNSNQEAEHTIEQWEETTEMEIEPIAPKTPLQQLLREYHDICEEILDAESDIDRDM